MIPPISLVATAYDAMLRKWNAKLNQKMYFILKNAKKEDRKENHPLVNESSVWWDFQLIFFIHLGKFLDFPLAHTAFHN